MSDDWRPISEKTDDVEFAVLLDNKNRLITFGYQAETPYWHRRPWWVWVGLFCRIIKPEATHFIALPRPVIKDEAS